MTDYDKQAGYENRPCKVCKKQRLCCQHHVSPGAYRSASKVIWVCDKCHATIHNPTAYKLPADWSYNHGYLIRSSENIVKRPKRTTCTHSKIYFNARLGYTVCQYCGKETTNESIAKPGRVKPPKRKISKKILKKALTKGKL